MMGQRWFSISTVCCSVSTISSIPHTQVGQLTSAHHPITPTLQLWGLWCLWFLPISTYTHLHNSQLPYT